MKTFSPLRYPGGKTFLTSLIIETILDKKNVSTFIEPFAGGAGVSLFLLLNNYVDQIFINDSDYLIFCIWDSILNETDKFVRRIEDTPVTIEEWQKYSNLLADEQTFFSQDKFQIGFGAFFLNRCNRSGMIKKSVGPIGGKSQTGKWKVDARFNKLGLISKIRKIAEQKDNIFLSNKDAVTFLKESLIDIQKTFVYLDPPYYDKGEQLYRKYFCDADHINLFNYLNTHREFHWMVSYDNSSFIRNLYRDFSLREIQVKHYAYQSHNGIELIIEN